MNFIGIDLEGVLIPEIWVSLSEKTGINELKLTTKDISDYKELMKIRIDILKKNKIQSNLLFEIAEEIKPYQGALDFLSEVRKTYQVIILSDTFSNLSAPIFKKLNYPTVFCHKLLIDESNMISGIEMCIEEHKKHTLNCMNSLNFNTIAIGADIGILFRSSNTIKSKYSQYFSCDTYSDLLKKIHKSFNK